MAVAEVLHKRREERCVEVEYGETDGRAEWKRKFLENGGGKEPEARAIMHCAVRDCKGDGWNYPSGE